VQVPQTPSIVIVSPLLFDKPWFLTEGKLAATLIIPSSWVSQRAGHHHAQGLTAPTSTTRHSSFLAPSPSSSYFSGAVAGEEEKTSARGVLRTHILYFVIVLLYFIYFYLHCFISKTQKN
jgi:hypothetical protein